MPDEVTDARAKLEHRVTEVRDLNETLDLLYGAFLERRLGKAWLDDLDSMQKWLRRDERKDAA